MKCLRQRAQMANGLRAKNKSSRCDFLFFFAVEGSHMWSNWWPYKQQQQRKCDKCAEYIVFFFSPFILCR